MRKNKWKDKSTNEIFSYYLELANEEGARLSKEFVAFFKMVETTALSIKHIAEMHSVNGKHFADIYRN